MEVSLHKTSMHILLCQRTAFGLSLLCRILCPLNVQGMAGNDIAMNQFQVVTSMKYVYGEKTDSGQAKMELPSLSALLSIKEIGITVLNDLNEAYKICNTGLSILHIALTMNSPIEYGICIHVQRASKGDVSGSQFIFQMVSGGGRTYIREGSGTTSFINYTDWRRI